MVAVDQLHYRLMPYIYSLAAKVTKQGYTIMRHLIFDYPNDARVFNIKDQHLCCRHAFRSATIGSLELEAPNAVVSAHVCGTLPGG